jgi:hypothetical protein
MVLLVHPSCLLILLLLQLARKPRVCIHVRLDRCSRGGGFPAGGSASRTAIPPVSKVVPPSVSACNIGPHRTDCTCFLPSRRHPAQLAAPPSPLPSADL